jgi:hypothetical protein
MPFVLLIAALLIGGLCALLALNTAAAAAELRRQSLIQANGDAADSVQQLRAELAARQAPAALSSAAAALGMVPADHPAFLRIQPNGGVVVVGSPRPATPSARPAPAPASTPTRRPTPERDRALRPTTAPRKPTPTSTPTGRRQ